MDPGRYGLQQGWDTNSAIEGYNVVHDPDFRADGSYGGRRFTNEGFSRDSVYGTGTFHRDMLERDNYPPSTHVPGVWPQPRRNFDKEYALVRDAGRHEPFHELDYRDSEKYHESFQNADRYRDNYRGTERYHDADGYHDDGFDRHGKFGSKDRDEMYNDYDFRSRNSHESRESSRDRDYDYTRYNYDSDHERGKRDSSWRRRESRDHRERERRDLSRERDQSPYIRHERSHSRGYDDRSRSRSPRGRSRGRSHREDSYDDGRYERNERRRDYDREDRRHSDISVAPSATVVVKGLSQKTTEEDLYQILAEWGPLRHVRVIKERNSGVSRGFAFIDFPEVEAARKMMDGIGDNGLVFDGRKLFFEYSSKPTGVAGAPSLGHESFGRSSHGHGKSISAPCDWMCTICGCINFARRTSCFQISEASASRSRSTIIAPAGSSGEEGWTAFQNILIDINNEASRLFIVPNQQHSEPSDHLPGLSDDVGAGFISGHSTQPAPGSDLNVDRLVELPHQDVIGSMGLSKVIRADQKRFFFDLGSNNRGHFLRISEVAGADRSSIILPLSGLKQFHETIGHFVEITKDRLEGMTSLQTVEPAHR